MHCQQGSILNVFYFHFLFIYQKFQYQTFTIRRDMYNNIDDTTKLKKKIFEKVGSNKLYEENKIKCNKSHQEFDNVN